MTSNLEQGATKRVERARKLLLTPKQEWPVIAEEQMTIGSIFKGWVLIFAAISPLAALIGSQLFGYGMFGITFRPSLGSSLTTAIVSYVMAIVGTFVAALVFNWLAPKFGGRADIVAAVKLAAFSFTASWLAGVFQLLPGLGLLSILGLYSLYLLYVGGPLLMHVPTEKAMSYTIVTVLVSVVLFLVAGALGSRIGGVSAPDFSSSADRISGTVGIPGVGSVDLGKIAAVGEQLEAASKQIEAGGEGATLNLAQETLAPDALQSLLPEALGPWQRVELSSSGASAGGLGGSQAEAVYRNGDQSFTLKVSDIAAVGIFASVAEAVNVQSSRQTETGYEKTGMVDGRMTTEEWDNSRNRGKYEVMVGSRFMVEASGSAPDIGTLKQAVAAIGFDRLEKLAGK